MHLHDLSANKKFFGLALAIAGQACYNIAKDIC
jgi:hypothetical protein